MDEKSNADSHEQDPVVEPLVKREHLNRTWIGLGAALEWIALRGQPIALKLYHDRQDAADEALAALLSDLPSAVAESVVRGAEAGAVGILVPVSSGIWRQTATSDANDADLPFRLIGTDDHDEWEGAILRTSQQKLQEGECPGYERVQIQSAFVLENWPENTFDIKPARPRVAEKREAEKALNLAARDESPTYSKVQIQPVFVFFERPDHTPEIDPAQQETSVASCAENAETETPSIPSSAAALPAVRRVVEDIIGFAQKDRAPISDVEMFELVKAVLPNARRGQVRSIYRALKPVSKRGPKGAREPDRKKYIEELGQKITPAELPN